MSQPAKTPTFEPLPDELDFPAMEHRILALWERTQAFEQLREKNKDGPRWSFIDGPITANNPMGVHHAWGRTYKDVYQRYRAMRGFHQRYQNGFDCQGLWLEVEVEKDLGFNSKRDIEAYGLAAFAERCRERVDTYAAVQTEQSIRLGQWMDWPNSYYTHTDTNIEHIWHFLKTCHANDWISKSQRAMPWCARCGTALSQHELIDTYREVEHDAVYVRLPLRDLENAWLLVWTTTPWTLAANVAAAVHPDLEYLEVEQDGRHYYLAAAAAATALQGDHQEIRRLRGRDLVGWTYAGPFDELPAVAGTEHRVIAWSDVGADEGTGIVHIAPGAGEEDFQLAADLDLPVLVPIDDNGRYVDGYGALTGRDAREVAADVIADLTAKDLLYRAHTYTHRYPHCWRCQEQLVFRVDDEWFIRSDQIRPAMLDAAATVRWTPDYAGARMADWLRNMGDWNISRRRFWGLPLPFYPCESCGHLTVIGSRKELDARAIEGLDQLRELHRPWIDHVLIRCAQCGEPVRRIEAVGDAWLDAGIVPFSTLGYMGGSDEWRAWYPADFVTEMREQIRLWFYSMLFMSVTLEGRSPYQAVFVFEKLNDETGRAMHKSWGNAIDFDEAADRMGADVMRWIYAGQNPLHNINFGYGPAGDVKRRMLTLWHVTSFFVTYARLDGFDPTQRAVPLDERADLDRWVLSRLQTLVRSMTDALEGFTVHRGVRAAQAFIEDLSNWYVRRGRRRYWKAENDADKLAAYQTLYEVLTTLVRLLAPVMPFWMEDIYQNLVRRVNPDAPDSVHLTEWPEVDEELRDTELEEAMSTVLSIVAAGREARNGVDIKLRQPLRAASVAGVADDQWASIERLLDHVKEELNVQTVKRSPLMPDFADIEAKLNFRSVGPRLGNTTKAAAREFANLRDQHPDFWLQFQNDSGYSVALVVDGQDVRLGREDLIFRHVPALGYGVGQDGSVLVGVAKELDDELVLEGLAREIVHAVQSLRKESGLDISDRIRLWLDGGEHVAEVRAAHGAWIEQEVLAVALNEGAAPPDIASAEVTLNAVPVVIGLARTVR